MQQTPPVPSDALREILTFLPADTVRRNGLNLVCRQMTRLILEELANRISEARREVISLTGMWLSLATELDSAIQESVQAGRISNPGLLECLDNGLARVSGLEILALSERSYERHVEIIDQATVPGLLVDVPASSKWAAVYLVRHSLKLDTAIMGRGEEVYFSMLKSPYPKIPRDGGQTSKSVAIVLATKTMWAQVGRIVSVKVRIEELSSMTFAP